MRLILSCESDDHSVMDKDNLLLLVDTETKEIKQVTLNINETNDIVAAKAMCMSGDYLMVSLKTTGKFDKLLVIDVVTEKNTLTNCTKSKDIHGMVSVFRGRVYCISTGTDSMNNIVLSPATNNVIRDVNHYTYDGAAADVYHFNSIINWNRRWYVSCFGKNWREDPKNGAIIELSKNNRIVYSNIDKPNSLFFNRNDKLCFCEGGKGLFHFGRKIIWIGRGYPRGVVEDHYDNGYWIASCGDNIIPKLKFFNYEGEYLNDVELLHGYSIHNIVEAEGYLSKLL